MSDAPRELPRRILEHLVMNELLAATRGLGLESAIQDALNYWPNTSDFRIVPSTHTTFGEAHVKTEGVREAHDDPEIECMRLSEDRTMIYGYCLAMAVLQNVNRAEWDDKLRAAMQHFLTRENTKRVLDSPEPV